MNLPIHAYDLIMILLLAAMALYGAWRGVAWQLASLASMVISALVAVKFGESLAPLLSREEPWNRFLAMLVLFLVTSLVIWVLFRLVSGLIDRLRLQEFDHQIGALFGLAKGVLLCIVITFFAVTLSAPARKAVLESRSGPFISILLRDATPFLPEKIRDVLGTYIEELQRNLRQAPAGQPGPAGTPPAVRPEQPAPPAEARDRPTPTEAHRGPPADGWAGATPGQRAIVRALGGGCSGANAWTACVG